MMEMRVSRRGFLRMGALVGIGCALAACTAPGGAGTTTGQAGAAAPGAAGAALTWWNPEVAGWQPAYQGMADEFMKQNSAVKVEIQNVPEDGFSEKISAMIASDTGPDVWVWYYATDTARRGFLEELTPFMERDS